MSLYKTPCPADLPPFSGLLETACGGGRIHTGGVPRYVRLRGASLPLLAPEVTQHCSARRRPNRQRRGTESSTSGRWDGLQRFPRAEARAVGIRGGKREGGGGRAPFARLRRDRAGAAIPRRWSSFGHFGRRRTKRCPPSWGTSLRGGYFLTACEEGHIEFTKERACCHRRQRHHLPKWG